MPVAGAFAVLGKSGSLTLAVAVSGSSSTTASAPWCEGAGSVTAAPVLVAAPVGGVGTSGEPEFPDP